MGYTTHRSGNRTKKEIMMPEQKGYTLRTFYQPGSIVYNSQKGRHEIVLEFVHCIANTKFASGWYVLVQPCNSYGVVRSKYKPYTHYQLPVFADFAGTLGRIRGV